MVYTQPVFLIFKWWTARMHYHFPHSLRTRAELKNYHLKEIILRTLYWMLSYDTTEIPKNLNSMLTGEEIIRMLS